MTKTYTPGPWTRGHNVSHEPVVLAAEMVKHPTPNGSFIIAQMFGPDKYDNADLVALAPELLEALDKLTGEVGACWGMNEHLLRQELGNTNYQIVMDRIEIARTVIAKVPIMNCQGREQNIGL